MPVNLLKSNKPHFLKIFFMVLLVIILVSRLLMVSKYPGDVDPALYILSFEQLANQTGKVSFIFNQEMSFGYYSLISLVYRFLDFDISRLVVFLNYLSAISGIILIFLFGLLAKRLAGINVAIFGILILLLDHSLWNWSLYGHPIVLSVSLFLLSLYAFDRSIIVTDELPVKTEPWEHIRFGYAILSGLSALASLVIRVDILFVFFAYVLIFNHRKKHPSKKVFFVFYGLIGSVYIGLKILALGYVIAPRGGIVVAHVSRLFRFKAIPAAFITNLGLFIAGIGAFFLLAALISIFWCVRKQSQYILPLILTLFPVFILIFFKEIDFSRYLIPIHPFLAFFAALTLKRIAVTSKKNMIWGVGGIIFAYILQTALVYYPIKEIWIRPSPLNTCGCETSPNRRISCGQGKPKRRRRAPGLTRPLSIRAEREYTYYLQSTPCCSNGCCASPTLSPCTFLYRHDSVWNSIQNISSTWLFSRSNSGERGRRYSTQPFQFRGISGLLNIFFKQSSISLSRDPYPERIHIAFLTPITRMC